MSFLPASLLEKSAHRATRCRAFLRLLPAVLLAATAPALTAAREPRDASSPYELPEPAAPRGRIDELVFSQLARLGIAPAHGCTDAVFLRRVFLDVIGTLPTAAEAQEFLEDQRPDKRRILIDRLLQRDEYADYWAMKWSDLLRVKAEFPINLWPNAAQAYHHWIRASLRDNLTFDRFARELLTSSGSNFRVGPVNFYRALQSRDPRAIARGVALTFMGTRAEKWPAAQLDGLAGFFTRVGFKPTGEWKEEIVHFNPAATPPTGLESPVFPDGAQPVPYADRDPREVFADWLIRPENPWFTSAIANRVWSWLLGRGIVHEPDDFRADNPPENPALLEYLAGELIAANYDVKHLFRLVLNSQTYQLSALPRSDDPQAAVHFASYPLRRLEAEVLIDALNQITGTTEKYSSAIPEPFTFIPEDQRSIALPDGSIGSSFLEMFGRPPRDTGLELERTHRFTSAQRLHLLNSTHIQRKIEQGPRLQALLRARMPPDRMITRLFLTILSRPPTAAERKLVAAQFAAQSDDPRAAANDIAWALINSTEFLHRH